MFTLNAVALSGNLTRDPERIANDKGAKFAIAVNERFKDGDDWRDYANFIDIVAWGSLADQVMKQLSKGTAVAIQGRLRQDRWETDGQKRSKVGVVAFAMFVPKSGNGSQGSFESDVPADTSGLGSSTSFSSDSDIPFN